MDDVDLDTEGPKTEHLNGFSARSEPRGPIDAFCGTAVS